MYCAFHPTNAATAHCSGCNRSLCAACDHRIKAQPFCEDCIVRGAEALRRPQQPAIQQVMYQPTPPRNAPSAAKATLLALIPGLGAVYNRQNLKALVHFLGTVGLWELADKTELATLGVGGTVFYLFTLIDANRTAKAIAAGVDPSEDERRIKWLFARYKPLWGVMLVVAAALAVLTSLTNLPFGLTQSRMLAGLMFVAGAYMIVSYFRSLRSEEQSPQFTTPPRSVVSSMLPPPDRQALTAEYTDSRSTSHLDR
jgi:hypothetical protein